MTKLFHVPMIKLNGGSFASIKRTKNATNLVIRRVEFWLALSAKQNAIVISHVIKIMNTFN